MTLDRSLLFGTTVVNAIAKVDTMNHVLRKYTSIKLNAMSIQIDSFRPVAKPILCRPKIKVCWVIFCWRLTFESGYFPIFGHYEDEIPLL